jgi:integrase
MARYIGRWEGGEVLRLKNGRRAYIINKRIGGRRWRITTRASTLAEARAVFLRFVVNPDTFRLVAPAPEPGRGPVHLGDTLLNKFLPFSRTKGNTSDWVAEQRVHLKVLQSGLAGEDLRGLPLGRLPPLVAGRAHRTAVAKALYAWLRKVEHRLAASEDPTFGTLVTPRRKPGERRIADKAVPREHIRAVVGQLSARWAALLELQAGTGIHTTELQRFARSGRLLPYVGPQAASVVMVVPLHKNGDEHRVALNKRLAAVARRALDGGTFCGEAYHQHVRRACLRAQVPHFTPGRMRHTVATELVEAGADIVAVSTFLGHRTPQTTRAWYARFATPRNPALDFNSSASKGLGR